MHAQRSYPDTLAHVLFVVKVDSSEAGPASGKTLSRKGSPGNDDSEPLPEITDAAPAAPNSPSLSPAISVTSNGLDGAMSLSPELQAYSELQEQLTTRFNSEQLADVSRAFVMARDAHSGQTRSSGEPYITHPVAVAGIVFELGLDHLSVMAALMHDVLEDTPVTRDALVDLFGEEVTHIVDGVSKLNHLKFRSKAEAQAQSFMKMLLAMVTDIRVIMIKLADRLHNMRTIGSLRQDKRRRIGKETLEVYAPIASRLGMFAVKEELEDLGFSACYPMRSRILQLTIDQLTHRNQILDRVVNRIQAALSEKGIKAKVTGREKHLYSLYKKMLKKQISFERVFDMLALRIIVDDTEDCYKALGVVHQLYPPIFLRFKDFIALPKQNGYQSLHTVLKHSDENTPLEVQIRTVAMHATAESGIAAHWNYKNDPNGQVQLNAPSWLERLVDLQNSATDSIEFVESVKLDLFPGEIYVFTPKGQIIQLPRHATPVDFAYAVHSEVGNKCVSAMIDKRLASLSTPLENGQTVEIITGANIAISPMWLNSVVTAKARTAVRQHLRELDFSEAVSFGERLLRRALMRHDVSLDALSDKTLNAFLSERRLADKSALFADIGLANHLPSQVATRLVDLQGSDSASDTAKPVEQEVAPVMIDSANSPTLYMAKCCRPIPEDNVRGFITPGKGVAVHRSGCRNVLRYRRRPKEWVAVDWAADIQGQFEVVIVCHLAHQPGALARVTSAMSMLNVNIENMDFNNRGEDDINIRFVLSVENRRQLARIVRRLRALTVVRSVKREN